MFTKSQQRFFVPEVIQSSAMDCGPASLKSLLEGMNISVSYGRLREACQTDLDGTSIDTLEEIAVQLGLPAEQVMVPLDHVLLPVAKTSPAIVVVRQPNGNTHFSVIWQRLGNFIQIMDPATGRHWIRDHKLLDRLYIHTMPVPAEMWREWAGTDDFLNGLCTRLHNIYISQKTINRLILQGLDDPSWRTLAALDAATRMTQSILNAGGLVQAENEIISILEQFVQGAYDDSMQIGDVIPATYWSVQPLPNGDPSIDEQYLNFSGAVLVRVLDPSVQSNETMADEEPAPSSELSATLSESSKNPTIELIHLLKEDGLLAPILLIVLLFISAIGLVSEAFLLRGLIDAGMWLALPNQRGVVISMILAFFCLHLATRFTAIGSSLRFGRHLEGRLRVALLSKLPKLNDRYFRSRLISDMVERSHSAYRLRLVPAMGAELLQAIFNLLLTTVGLLWLAPESTFITLLAVGFALGIPVLMHPILSETDLRVRSHLGALSRFYLDGLLGLTAIRAYSAERSVRREHNSLLTEWARAGTEFYSSTMLAELLQVLIGTSLTVWLVFDHIGHFGNTGSTLLLVYWALNLVVFGQEISFLASRYPSLRNIALRLLEPLQAPEIDEQPDQKAVTLNNIQTLNRETSSGVNIELHNVSVNAGGQEILHNVSIDIEAGEHVAIIGASGAGKSTLLGLLLGWHRPSTGDLLIDGLTFDEKQLNQLRSVTAWIDPSIQIWNRSLFENLLYGNPNKAESISQVIEAAQLYTVLESLPDGLQSTLGESGGLVSGGEGQRVRLGRAMLRDKVRLALLDEPFRGLDRKTRHKLLSRSRELWSHATLLCVTHDVSETLNFDRVLIVEAGQIIEQGSPQYLASQQNSRYHSFLAAERSVYSEFWSSRIFRKISLHNGKVIADSAADGVSS